MECFHLLDFELVTGVLLKKMHRVSSLQEYMCQYKTVVYQLQNISL